MWVSYFTTYIQYTYWPLPVPSSRGASQNPLRCLSSLRCICTVRAGQNPRWVGVRIPTTCWRTSSSRYSANVAVLSKPPQSSCRRGSSNPDLAAAMWLVWPGRGGCLTDELPTVQRYKDHFQNTSSFRPRLFRQVAQLGYDSLTQLDLSQCIGRFMKHWRSRFPLSYSSSTGLFNNQQLK